jgi:hypothetical protein
MPTLFGDAARHDRRKRPDQRHRVRKLRKDRVKITMASRKLAAGPAKTVAARRPTELVLWKRDPAFLRAQT